MHDAASRTTKDAPVVAADAGVTFVMPVLNERAYLERAVRTVLEQDVAGRPVELVLALGPSSDGTTELARRLAAEDPRIVLVDNPAADIPVGLNLAIRAGHHPTIVRVDAHSELTGDYTRRALETLERVRAANVGGIMRADGRTPFQRAVARAYNSPIGLAAAPTTAAEPRARRSPPTSGSCGAPCWRKSGCSTSRCAAARTGS